METHQEQNLAIENLIFSFGAAFNAADVSKTVASFTYDGTNMTNNGPSAQGTENLTKAFAHLFSMAEINIKYDIDEVLANGETAFARTNSKVTTIFKSNGAQVFLENKELFILRRQNGEWKISHYIFNNTKITK